MEPATHSLNWTFPTPEGLVRPRNPRPAPVPVVLPEARLFSHNGTIIDRDNRIRADLSPDFRPPSSGHRILDYPALPAPERVDARVFVLPTPAAWKNYFHWLIDSLPRLLGIDLRDYDRVATPLNRPYHHQTLELLDLPEGSTLEVREWGHFRCRELVAVSPHPLHRIDGVGAAYLRDLFGVPPGRSTRRLYLGRGDSWRRRILNEAALISELDAYGFEPVLLSRMNIVEQARLLSSAEAVVAPHGAALANLVFAPSTCRVLELFPSNWVGDQYEALSRTCGLSYRPHFSENSATNPDFEVNLASLRPVLRAFV